MKIVYQWKVMGNLQYSGKSRKKSLMKVMLATKVGQFSVIRAALLCLTKLHGYDAVEKGLSMNLCKWIIWLIMVVCSASL